MTEEVSKSMNIWRSKATEIEYIFAVDLIEMFRYSIEEKPILHTSIYSMW